MACCMRQLFPGHFAASSLRSLDRVQSQATQCPTVSLTSRQFWNWSKPRSYSVIRPAVVSPQKTVPNTIRQPEYAVTGIPANPTQPQVFSNADDVERVRRACQLAKRVLSRGREMCKVGVSTDEIDSCLHDMIVKAGAYPSPLNYRSFPKSICTSVNNVLCHGIPDSRPLESGDIISIDVTVYLDGVHGDTCATLSVGEVDEEGERLMSTAKSCTQAAIAACSIGKQFDVIPNAIASALEGSKFYVSPSITGHGVGEYFHAPPVVCHAGPIAETLEMSEGMVFTVEPVITAGIPAYRTLKDNWTLVSLNHCRAAQFEHTVIMKKDGAEILTA